MVCSIRRVLEGKSMILTVEAHPSLDASAFSTVFPAPVGTLESPAWLVAGLALEAAAPFERGEDVRATIRDLLRHGGYKPTGRGKPASEYLVRAATEGTLASINAAVDVCNVVSLHSGLPITVIDVDRATAPFHVGLADPGARYVFNASGQEIDVGGLLCLHDAEGPCGNAVKDSQRTKTHAETVRTLTVIWGSTALGDRTARATAWYREMLERLGAAVEPLPLQRSQT
jgi:DNA/RNA-binding domain of Phe-tRNA-synthetase-like protein